MRFENPWMLLGLTIVPVAFLVRRWRRNDATTLYSSVTLTKKLIVTWRQRLRWIPMALRALALTALTIAAARPQKGLTHVINSSEGIAMEVVIDRSGSMRAEMPYRGKELNRLQVVKKILEEFTLGNGDDLKGRPDDLIGIVAFARYADTICPLTLGHDAIPHFLKSIKLAKTQSEGGTAIGDALALATARLRLLDEKEDDNYLIKNKVILILTDGRQEGPVKLQPMEAAAMAKKNNVKIYAIGIGKAEEYVQTAFGRQLVPGVDEETLKEVATYTGGRYFSAENAETLQKIYREIDELEKSKINSDSFVDYKELFPLIVIVALGLIVAEVTLSMTLFRRLP